MTTPRHVCVIGAGVVGCATAYALASAGLSVTLIDAEAGPSRLASFANGAQLSYSHVQPLATPDLLPQLPGLLLSRHSPLRFSLQLDPHQWTWGLRFLLACNAATVERSTVALLRLAYLSRDTLAAWMRSAPLQFEHATRGKLVLYGDAASLAAAARQVEMQRHHGAQQHLATPQDCARIEPALASQAHRFAGGVWTPDEAVGDAHLLSLGLQRELLAHGGRCLFDTRVTGFRHLNGRVHAALTTSGDVPADAFVLCGGMGTLQLGRLLGIRLPLYPIKGYSVSIPIKDAALAPRASITDIVHKVVFAVLGNKLRVAGMAELPGAGLRIDPARIRSLVQSAERLFPGACEAVEEDGRNIAPWAGQRPASPTARPFIGGTRYGNVWLNTGHGALGLTLAAGSAACMRSLVLGQPPAVPVEPFAL
jgi:D-amino-acid dehydrogenase